MKEKIGLIIGVISAGERKVYLSESAKKWERYYMDPRSYLKKVANNDNSTFVDFICYGDDVALYYINKSIDGRPGDAVFGMISIPSNISISGEKLEDIINLTREELAKTEYDSSKLDELYSTPYDVRAEIKSCTNSIENERFAVQKYGKNTDFHLYELLDKNLFSTCYNSFKAVFLINEDDEIIPNEDVEEINQELIDSFSVLKYPKGYQYELLIKKKPFTSDYQTKYGSTIEIDVKRNGYVSQRIPVIIDSQIVDIEKQLRQIQWKILVQKSWFNFIDEETNAKIKDFTIKINDIEIVESTPVSETILKTAKVYVKANGFVDANFNYMEAARVWQDSGLNVALCKLKRAPKAYEYYVEDNEYDIHFNIESAHFDVTKSPLSRYKVTRSKSTKEGEKIYLAQSNRFNKTDIYIAIGIVLVLFSLGVLCGYKINDNENPNIDETEIKIKLNKAVSDAVEDVVSYIANKRFDELAKKYQILNNNSDYNSFVNEYRKLINKGIDKDNNNNSGDEPSTPVSSQTLSIATLLDKSTWRKNEFSQVNYSHLYNALNNYQYAVIIRIYEELIKSGIGKQEGTTYQSWNNVVKICKGNPTQLKGPYSNNGQISLSNWIKRVQQQTVDYSVLGGTRWKKSDFETVNLLPIYNAIKKYDLDELRNYKQHFPKSVQSWLDKTKDKSLNISQFDDKDGKIDMWPWLENIQKANDNKIKAFNYNEKDYN